MDPYLALAWACVFVLIPVGLIGGLIGWTVLMLFLVNINPITGEVMD